MDDRYDVEALLLPPPGAGAVLLLGAATLVSQAVDDLELDVEYFVEQAGPDGAGVRCVGVVLDEAEVEAVRDRAEAALKALVTGPGELAGWGVRVRVFEASDEDDDAAERDEPVIVPDSDPVDGLLPTGDELFEELIHAIEHEQAVYADAVSFRAVPIGELVPEDLDELPPDERVHALRRASALAGCLIHASVWVVDNLFEDFAELRDADQAEPVAIDDTWILSGLPPRFAAQYTTLFTKEFLVATVDLTGRLTRPWEPLSCVAQELGLRLILNAVEVVADSADVALTEDWREHVEGLFFSDLDHEDLYDDDAEGSRGPMDLDSWFTPFDDGMTLPPYALPARPFAD